MITYNRYFLRIKNIIAVIRIVELNQVVNFFD